MWMQRSPTLVEDRPGLRCKVNIKGTVSGKFCPQVFFNHTASVMNLKMNLNRKVGKSYLCGVNSDGSEKVVWWKITGKTSRDCPFKSCVLTGLCMIFPSPLYVQLWEGWQNRSTYICTSVKEEEQCCKNKPMLQEQDNAARTRQCCKNPLPDLETDWLIAWSPLSKDLMLTLFSTLFTS